MKGTKMTWEQIRAKKAGTILHDVFDEGIRFIVMRGPSNLCAYVGLPLKHPLAGFHYDDVPLNAHGGLTFAGEGDTLRPTGFFWYGWDYGHCRDRIFYADDLPASLQSDTDKKWLVEDVIEDSWETIYDFKALARLAEKIKEDK